MLLTSAWLLVYTAMIVPIQICMWNYDDPCNMFPTLYFDVFVDLFFMVLVLLSLGIPYTLIRLISQFEILVQFFVGKYHKDLEYIDNIFWILKTNLTTPSGFWFDCITSIPWSCIDFNTHLVLPKKLISPEPHRNRLLS